MAGGLRERSVAIRRYGITYRGGICLKKNKTMIVVFLTVSGNLSLSDYQNSDHELFQD